MKKYIKLSIGWTDRLRFLLLGVLPEELLFREERKDINVPHEPQCPPNKNVRVFEPAPPEISFFDINKTCKEEMESNL